MIIQRVRLQRKFTMRIKIDPKERLAAIAQMIIVFELSFVVITALLSLSPHFRLHHLFTTQFWTAEPIINSNLSLAFCVFLLLPYLIFWLEVQGSSVKDFVATALTLHLVFSFLINLRVTLSYTLFLVVIGVVGGILGSYGAVMREQKRLIEDIQRIEGVDRQDQSLQVEQCQRMHLSDN